MAHHSHAVSASYSNGPVSIIDHPPLDKGIAPMVAPLREAGIETFESCEGGDGHAFPVPTIRFHGMRDEGPRAVAVAMRVGLKVVALRRVWDVIDGEMTGPWWEMVFTPTAPSED